MTACFAGPVFNMLVGVGVGFAMLLSSDDEDAADGDDQENKNDKSSATSSSDSYKVTLPSGVLVGFIFIIVNCAAVTAFGVFNKNFVPKKYGFVSLTMYAIYLIVSFILIFSTEK